MNALLELFLRSALLCAAMGLLALLVGRRRVAFRHNVLRLTMGLLLVLPFTLLLPHVSVPVLPALGSSTVSAINGFDAGILLCGIWLTGVALFGLTHLAGIFRLRWMLRRATPLSTPAWSARLHTALEALECHEPVRILLVPGIAGPAAMRWRKPLVLLPPSALDWPADRARVVLLHELAHLVRNDPQRRWFERLICMVYWFNPLVWIIKRMLHDTRELVCDSMVINCGTPPARYAEHLLAIATETPGATSLPAPALAMAPPRSRLGHRIRGLFAISAESRRNASVPLFLTTVLSVAGITFVAVSVDLAAPSVMDRAEALIRLTADPFPGN